MRRLTLLALAAAVAAAGVLAGSAGAWLDPPAPNMGVSGGGYTLINPGNPNVEANRARFEFALRQQQTSGWISGKLLTIRTSKPDGTKLVVRAWPQYPNPGSPAKPGQPWEYYINPCSMSVGVLPDGFSIGEFSAYGAVTRVLPNGTEVPYLDQAGHQMTVGMSIVFRDYASTLVMDEIHIDSWDLATALAPPFPMPNGTLASGALGITDGTVLGCLGWAP